MKKKIFALLTLVIMLFALGAFSEGKAPLSKTASAVSCKWEMIAEYAPQSYARSVAIDPLHPNIIYAAIGLSLYKSTNYGHNWSQLIANKRIWDIAVDYKNPLNVYVTEDNGLYKSTDGGIHWTKTLSRNTTQGVIAIDPNNPKIMYVGDADGRIYRSANAGNSWVYLKDLGSNDVWSISICKNHSNIIYASLKSGLFKSVNSGQTWTTLSSSSTFDVKVSPDDEQLVYAVFHKDSSHSVVYKSSDGGTHWTKIFAIGYTTEIEIDPHNPSTIYIPVWGGGVYKSADGGAHWQTVNSGLKTLSAINIIVDPAHPSVLYCVTREPGTVYERIYRYVCTVSAPTDFTTHFSGNTISLSWKYPEDADIDHFEIQYKQAGSSSYHMLANNIDKTKRSFTKSNFTTINTSFDFFISAYRETENSLWIHDTARHLMKPSITLLKTYSNTATSSKVKIMWNKSTIDSHTDYIEIWRSNPDCSGYLCLPVFVKKINKGSADFNNGYTYIDSLKFDKKYTAYLTVYDDSNGQRIDTNSDYKTAFIPNLPKDFQAYADGNEIHFFWDYSSTSVSHIDNFKIFMLLPTSSLVKTIAPSERTATASALHTGKHTFFITAYKDTNFTNSTNDSAYVLKKPDVPLLSVENGRVKVQWDKNAIDSNANKVDIYKSTNSGPFSLLASVDKNIGEFTDPSVSANVNYSYGIKVERTSASGHSDISSVSETSSIKLLTPANPTNLSLTANSCSEVALNWSDNSDNEEHFVIERKEEEGNYGVIATVNENEASYADNTVEGGKIYYYRVKAVNGIGESGYSNEAHLSVPECETSPAAPNGLTATANSCSEVALNWTDNADNEEHFVVERKKAGGTYLVIITLGSGTTAYTDSSVTAETTYYYRVKATNSIGDSNYSNEANVNVPACETAPTAPSNLTATAVSSSEIDLSWTDNSDNEGGFRIERKISGGTYSLIATVTSDATSYRDTGLSAGTTYYYRLRAFNDEGFSAYTNSANATAKPDAVQQTVIKLWPDNPNMLVNGVKQEIDPGRGTKPVIIPKWSRTVVPIRAIVEALGGTIEWDGKERKVTINFNETTIELWIDNPKAKVNETAKWIDEKNHDVKPIIINSRTMLPLRFVAESLGCEVNWDPATKTITITYTP